MGIRIGTPGNQSAINIMRATSDEIVGNLDANGVFRKKGEPSARSLAQLSVIFEEVRWDIGRKTMLVGTT